MAELVLPAVIININNTENENEHVEGERENENKQSASGEKKDVDGDADEESEKGTHNALQVGEKEDKRERKRTWKALENKISESWNAEPRLWTKYHKSIWTGDIAKERNGPKCCLQACGHNNSKEMIRCDRCGRLGTYQMPPTQ